MSQTTRTANSSRQDEGRRPASTPPGGDAQVAGSAPRERAPIRSRNLGLAHRRMGQDVIAAHAQGAWHRDCDQAHKSPRRNRELETNWMAYPIDGKRDRPDFPERTGRRKPMMDKDISPIFRERFVRRRVYRSMRGLSKSRRRLRTHLAAYHVHSKIDGPILQNEVLELSL